MGVVAKEAAGTVITVAIADDHHATLIGLRTILESDPRITVVAAVTTGPEACAMAEQFAPDVMLMDVRMPGFSGIEATRRISSWMPRGDRARTKVIILTTFDRADSRIAALRAGAHDVMLKHQGADEIIEAVLAAGGAEPRAVSDESASTMSRWGTSMARLTPRQREVLILLAAGRTNVEISRALCISRETVKSHVKQIYVSLGLHDRAQVVAAAYEHGLVEPRLGARPGSPGVDAQPPRRASRR